MRLGIFGGTFDPIHYGHLILAEQCLEQCELDEIWFVPTGIPPHKPVQAVASGTARAEMLEFAVAGHAQFRVDVRELKKPTPSYTVETLAELQAEDPNRELHFLMGADSLRDLPTWRDPPRIFEQAILAVVNRNGAAIPDLTELNRLYGSNISDRLRLVSIPAIDLSSHDIRRRVRAGKSIRFMTPRAVECYIEKHDLYSDAP